MPTTPTFPGVYIEEVPSGVRTIVGVATSIGAFIDVFRRGPRGRRDVAVPRDVAVQIFSFADFEREFGGLDAASEASYAIQQFFLNGGTEAFVVRVGTGALVAASTFLTKEGDQLVQVRAGRRYRGALVENPGTWGNFVYLDVDYDTVTVPNTSVDPVVTQNELFNLTVTEVELREGQTVVLQTETFRNLTLRTGVRNNAVNVVNEGSRLVQLDRDLMGALSDPPPRPDRLLGTLSGPPPPPPIFPTGGKKFEIKIDPDGPGAGSAAAITKTVTLNYIGADPTTLSQLQLSLQNSIRAAAPADNNPLFTGATVEVVGNRLRILAGRPEKNYNPRATVTFADIGADTFAADLRLVGVGVVVGPQQFALSGGVDSGTLTDAEIRGSRAAKTGFFALEDVDLFNILCLPAAVKLAAAGMRAVYAAAEAYCEERRAFLIVDIPEDTNSLDAMQTWLVQNETLRHRNAAVYFPRVLIPDPLKQNRLRDVAASGTLAGLYALTDTNRGVWKAPAGTDARLRGVQQLVYVLTDRENGALNPLGVNCLRNFPVFSNIAWGARTLDGADQQASDWKYIPVRRLALFLEESLYRGTKFAVFEPNDEPLWAQIRLNLGAFMQDLFRKGAFQGRTPREAYFVKCDKETTTQTDINLGIVNVVVGFAPLKPAEFVIIKIQQMAGQIPT